MKSLRLAKTISALPFLSLWRKLRPTGAVNGLVALPVLNALVIGGLYMTVDGQPLDIHRLSAQRPYFVGTASFIAGVASWEVELLSGMLGSYAGRVSGALLSRLTYITAAVAPMIALFLALLALAAEPNLAEALLTMLVVSLGFSMLGIGIALNLGFGHDKGINNLAQLTPWLFALGASPFFPQGVPCIRWLLPPSGDQISLVWELTRTAILVLAAWMLTYRALGAKRAPVYEP